MAGMTAASPRQFGCDPGVSALIAAGEAAQRSSKSGYAPATSEAPFQIPSVNPTITLAIRAMPTKNIPFWKTTERGAVRPEQ